MIYKINPSDLTFTWERCKYCFYVKVKYNISFRGIFPKIFEKMADLTSLYYMDKTSSEISKDLPRGKIQYREEYVKSVPIQIPGCNSQCFIVGRCDAIITFDDGSYGIIDYKTSEAKSEHAEFYKRQLNAYAYALEKPANNSIRLSPITRLGIFIITPERFDINSSNEVIFINKTTWLDVKKDEKDFLTFMKDVLGLLESTTTPMPSDNCDICNYRMKIDRGNNP